MEGLAWPPEGAALVGQLAHLREMFAVALLPLPGARPDADIVGAARRLNKKLREELPLFYVSRNGIYWLWGYSQSSNTPS